MILDPFLAVFSGGILSSTPVVAGERLKQPNEGLKGGVDALRFEHGTAPGCVSLGECVYALEWMQGRWSIRHVRLKT